MATKPITNQRTKEEIREEVKSIDSEVPETKEFVEIMEKDKVDGEEPVEIPEETTPEVKEEVVEEPEGVKTVVVEEEPEEKPKEEPAVEKKLPPIEDRYKEAGQEAMILNSKNQKIIETIEEAENIPEPSVEELRNYARTMGEDYDNLDTFAQNILKKTYHNERKLGKITGLVAEEREIKAWVKKVEDFVDDEKTIQAYPELESQKEEFIKYSAKKSHVGADFNLLVAGFMWKQPVKKPMQGSVLLPSGKGVGGQPKSEKPAGLTEDDAIIYRKSDPKKYKELIKKRKFTVDV